MNIVESANDLGAFYFLKGTQRRPYSGLTCLILSHPDNQALITEGITTFQDFLPNVYFNEDSMKDGNLVKKGHDNINTITYESFLEKGEKTGVCKDCSYVGGTTEVDPLFTCLGFSTPEDGTAGITIGFILNNDAIAEYELSKGKAMSYGAFAVLRKRIGNNDIIDENGATRAGVISVDLSSYSLSSFDLKIFGFTTDDYKALELAMGAYVIEEKEESSTISYLQSGAPASGEKYSFISYNALVK